MDAAALIFMRRLVAAAVLSLATLPLLPVRAADAALAPAAPALTAANDNLWDLSARWPREAGASRQQWMVAVLRRNPQAFVGGNIHRLRVGMALQLPTAAEVAAEDAGAAVALIEAHRAAWTEGRAVTLTAQPAMPAQAPSPAPAPAPAPAPHELTAAPAAPVAVSAAPSMAAPPATVVAAPSAAASASAAEAQPAQRPAAPPAQAEAPPARPGMPWWPLALLLVAAAGGAALWWRRRHARQRFEESVISSFFDENGERRVSRPRIVDVSQAAADMARTVETLQAADQVVRGQAGPVAAAPAASQVPEPALKLALARASLELGQTERARALLQAVRREGPAAAQQEADALLATLPTA